MQGRKSYWKVTNGKNSFASYGCLSDLESDIKRERVPLFYCERLFMYVLYPSGERLRLFCL